MRKFSLALLLVGCQPETVPSNHRAIMGGPIDEGYITFDKKEYEGHSYIIVRGSSAIVSGFQFSGLEHDPDCPCSNARRLVSD